MSNRRQFLEQALVGCGVVAFRPRMPLFLLGGVALPDGWRFYEVSGQVLFPLYGASGMITTRSVCYLMKRVGRRYYAITVAFDEAEIQGTNKDIQDLVRTKLTKALECHPIEVNADGGLLPHPEEMHL